jgi:DNA-binding MurR/RpiR family transcriptional regulator
VKAAEEAKASGASIISLTRFGQTPVSELGDIKLFIPSTERLVREGAMASRIAQLTMIDILYSIIASRDTDSAFSHLDRTQKAVHSIGR